MNRALLGTTLLSLFAFASACGDSPPAAAPVANTTPPSATTATPSPTVPAAKYGRASRPEFNRIAAELALPLFWTVDKNQDGQLQPDEVTVYWGLDKSAKLSDYVKDSAFTSAFDAAYEKVIGSKSAPAPQGDDGKRRLAVRKELSQGRVTLATANITKLAPGEKQFVRHVLRAADLIESLYAEQQGTTALAAKVPSDNPASKTLFFRGQGPKCEGPATQNDPNCSALPLAETPKGKISGLYPQDMLGQEKFCDELAKKDKKLVDPFTVVTRERAVPYNEAYKPAMTAVAKELTDGATALGTSEPALRAYLLAAAKAFADNQWWPADEAWAKMDAKNSKFYLRIAPDEVYDEPCSTKALFHVSFGLINQASLAWQQKIDPLKTEMEGAIAQLAGAPYAARKVTFKLPDFFDVVLNAGDSRKPFGATIGQSLPNFGPVANEGRGRTVAMTNINNDPDSLAAMKDQGASLFCKETFAKFPADKEALLLSTVLHEATHNLGPAHQYKVAGKIDREQFGGPLASTLEELKAQSGALFFTDLLVQKKLITQAEAEKSYVGDLLWAFGHISRGMWTEEHHPKPYSQLAAIQLASLMKSGAVSWNKDEKAANGTDKGCFEIAIAKMPAAGKTILTEVAQIKGKGDKARAEALVKEHVDVTGEKKALLDLVTERITRAPKASFVYAVTLD